MRFFQKIARPAALIMLIWVAASVRAADMGTGFTYQGRLEKPPGTPVDGPCGFRFGLWTDATSTLPADQIGSNQVLPIDVQDGIFTAVIDFFTQPMDGTARWLQVEVQCAGDPGFQVLTPRVQLRPVPHALALPGLYTQQTVAAANIIAGHNDNVVLPGVVGATIGGGGGEGHFAVSHQVSNDYGTIGGGLGNSTGNLDSSPNEHPYATVAGGSGNAATAQGSTVGGGLGNWAAGVASTVPGGSENLAGGNSSLAAGFSAIVRDAATVGGGDTDGDEGTFVWADRSEISSFQSTGPNQFLIRAQGGVGVNTNNPQAALDVEGDVHSNGTISSAGTITLNGAVSPPSIHSDDALEIYVEGNRVIRIDPEGPSPVPDDTRIAPNVIGGWHGNAVSAGVTGATIAGGGAEITTGDDAPNTVSAAFGTIGGGIGNTVSGVRATVAGGDANLADGLAAFVGGGVQNIATGAQSTIAGGSFNTASGLASAITGGDANGVSAQYGTVGGGERNTIGSDYSTIAGGKDNLVTALGAAIGGGLQNTAGGFLAAIGGGIDNIANGTGATIPGGLENVAAGDTSFAAGTHAQANHPNTFVWNSFAVPFASTAAYQFLINAKGGVGIGTNAPLAQLHVHTLESTAGENTATFDAPNIGPQTSHIHFGTTGDWYIRSAASNGRVILQDGGGNVGVGTTTPSSKLEIAAQDGLAITGFQPFITLRDTDAGNARARIANASGTFSFFPDSFIGGNAAVVITDTTGRMGIGDTTPEVALDVVGDINYTGVITDISDERLKEDIRLVDCALEKVGQLRGVSFTMKNSTDEREVGLIAQEVQKVLPEAVRIVDNEHGYLGVSYPSVVSLLVEAVKEIQSKKHCEFRKLSEANAALAKSNSELEARLARIEQLLLETSNNGGK